MAKKESAKKESEATVKTTKIQICFNGNSATIYRKGASFICDTADKSIEWLAAQGFKREDIEVVGKKPLCKEENWTFLFPAPAEKEPALVVLESLSAAPAVQ